MLQCQIVSREQKEQKCSIQRDIESIRQRQLIQILQDLTRELINVEQLDFLNKQLFKRVIQLTILQVRQYKNPQAEVLLQMLKQIKTQHQCYEVLLPILRQYSNHFRLLNNKIVEKQRVDWSQRSKLNRESRKEGQLGTLGCRCSGAVLDNSEKENYIRLNCSSVGYEDKLEIIQTKSVSTSGLLNYVQDRVRLTFGPECPTNPSNREESDVEQCQLVMSHSSSDNVVAQPTVHPTKEQSRPVTRSVSTGSAASYSVSTHVNIDEEQQPYTQDHKGDASDTRHADTGRTNIIKRLIQDEERRQEERANFDEFKGVQTGYVRVRSQDQDECLAGTLQAISDGTAAAVYQSTQGCTRMSQVEPVTTTFICRLQAHRNTLITGYLRLNALLIGQNELLQRKNKEQLLLNIRLQRYYLLHSKWLQLQLNLRHSAITQRYYELKDAISRITKQATFFSIQIGVATSRFVGKVEMLADVSALRNDLRNRVCSQRAPDTSLVYVGQGSTVGLSGPGVGGSYSADQIDRFLQTLEDLHRE